MTTLLALLLSSNAHAVPLQMSQHGRLLDANGAALTGQHDLTFRIYDDLSTGSMLWEETLTASFSNGYYSVVLGTNTSTNPLDEDVLSLYPIYLEMELDSYGPMSPRQPINSAPYAQRAGVAESVEGGQVDATEVSINGNQVIDGNGEWVGNLNVDWNNITSIPSDLADGDNDTQLSESTVEGYITNGAIDLNSGTTIGGMDILTVDNDSLANLSCLNDGDVPVWDSSLGWGCDTVAGSTLSESDVEFYVTNGALDLANGTTLAGNAILTAADTLTPDWNDIQNVPAGFADGIDDDTQLSETEVENYVTNDAIDLHADTTIGGQPIGGSGSSLSSPVWLGETDGGSQFTSQDTPMTIPDNNTVGITSTRYVADAISIETMSMDLQITHPDMSEVTVTLTSPAGTTITVYDGEDAGSNEIDLTIGWDRKFTSGDLYSFYGEDSTGVWLLNVVDGSGTTSQTGSLESWSLHINEEWDGTMFVGNNIVAQESISTRGEMRIEYGGALVMTNTDGVETLRLEAENPASVLTTANISDKVYTNESGYSNNGSTVYCDAGDLMLSGGCAMSSQNTQWDLHQSYPQGQNGWFCRSGYTSYSVKAYVRCLDLD